MLRPYIDDSLSIDAIRRLNHALDKDPRRFTMSYIESQCIHRTDTIYRVRTMNALQSNKFIGKTLTYFAGRDS